MDRHGVKDERSGLGARAAAGRGQRAVLQRGRAHVGIDRVIEQAGVAKASLYNTFGSKDELVRAYLETRHASVTQRVRQAVEPLRDPAREAAGRVRSPGRAVRPAGLPRLRVRPGQRRGPARRAGRAGRRGYRSWVRDLLTELAAQAGAADPESWPASCTCSTTAPPRRATWTTTAPRPPRPGPPPRRPARRGHGRPVLSRQPAQIPRSRPTSAIRRSASRSAATAGGTPSARGEGEDPGRGVEDLGGPLLGPLEREALELVGDLDQAAGVDQ